MRMEVLLSGSVGLLALFVSAYTVYIQRQQLKVQAWPRLTIEVDSQRGSGPDEAHTTISLKNRGVAPAEVRAMQMTFEGHAVTDWQDYLVRLMGSRGLYGDLRISKAFSPLGSVLGVGQEVPLLATESLRTDALLIADEKSTISICYCSVLDDCWLLEVPARGVSTTAPVAHCPTYATNFGQVDKLEKEWAERFLDAGEASRASADSSIDAAPERK